MEIDTLDFLLKTGASAFAGFFMGLERELKGKGAGLKTNTLVAIGACVFMLMSIQYEGEPYADVTRVLSQIVVGVGFLGTGVILQRHDKIKGLATAATIWCSAAAGCLAATDQFTPLSIFTGLVILVNLILGYLNSKVEGKMKHELKDKDN